MSVPSVSFRQLQDKKLIKRADSQKALLQNIFIVPGFNKRILSDEYQQAVEHLAEQIFAGLQVGALEVSPCEKGVEVVDGHTRHGAHSLLFAQGRHPGVDKTGDLWLEIVPTNAKNAFEKQARIVQTQNNRKLSAIELGSNYKTMREIEIAPGVFPTMQQIADQVGMTKAHVEQMLLIYEATQKEGGEVVEQMVESGQISSSLAVQLVREHGENVDIVLKDELAQANKQGKSKITAATMTAPKVPRTILEEMAGHFGKIEQGLSTLDRVKLTEYQKGALTDDDNESVYVPVGQMLALYLAFDEMKRLQQGIDAKQREKMDKAKQEALPV